MRPLIAFAVVAAIVGCTDREIATLLPDPTKVERKTIPIHVNRNLDLLFVIDNSGSMAEEQASLRASFPAFIDTLSAIKGGLPDLHLGVITSDMGTNGAAPFGSGRGACTPMGGNGQAGSRGGDLRRLEPPDAKGTTPIYYLRNVQDPTNPTDPTARITNYRLPLDEAFSKLAQVGDGGCGFEMPLAAMRRAIAPDHPLNAGFIRDDAYLAVVFIGDEDDCSVAPSQSAAFFAQGDLGDVQSYACFRSSTVCNPDQGDRVGLRTNCRPNDGSRYHDDVAEFAELLAQRKGDPRAIIVSGIIGDTSPIAVGSRRADSGAVVPTLAPSCRYAGGGNSNQSAYPGVRLATFLNAFPYNTATTICASDLDDGLQQIAKLFAARMGYPCMEGDLETDPLQCTVSDVVAPGEPFEQRTAIPRCERAQGVLPCWTMTADLRECPKTKTHLKLEIQREQGDPPVDTHVQASCVTK